MFWKTFDSPDVYIQIKQSRLEGSLGTILSNSFLFPDEEIGAQSERPGQQPPVKEGVELGFKPAVLCRKHRLSRVFYLGLSLRP